MNNFEDLKQWTDEVTLYHTIKILQDSGLSKDQIITELNLTETEYNKVFEQ